MSSSTSAAVPAENRKGNIDNCLFRKIIEAGLCNFDELCADCNGYCAEEV